MVQSLTRKTVYFHDTNTWPLSMTTEHNPPPSPIGAGATNDEELARGSGRTVRVRRIRTEKPAGLRDFDRDGARSGASAEIAEEPPAPVDSRHRQSPAGLPPAVVELTASEAADTVRPPATRSKVVRPVDEERELFRGRHAGDRAVRIRRPQLPGFRRVAPNVLEASPETYRPRGAWGRLIASVKRVVIGKPIATAHQMHERLSKVKALAIFSSDALSSVAYATEAALRQLVVAGALALSIALPISGAIIALLIVVVLSYRQTINAYPQGGGSYRVAKDNLGTIPGLVAGAAILIDYVLTVAVSVSAGVAAITSAYQELIPYKVGLCLFFILLITLLNLRGVSESGTILAVPTYVFLLTMMGMLGLGLARMLGGVPFIPPIGMEAAGDHGTGLGNEPITVFLVLRAFASGCSALTGVEAITDGVPAFKPPESKNAATTLAILGVLLGILFAGTSVLSSGLGIVPVGEETVLSQIGHYAFGSGPLYLLLQFSTMAILVLAANTAFADFPRLSSVMARDKFLASHFAYRGDRLAFTNGIVLLGVLAATLTVIFHGDEHGILPLYTVGVFLSFTLSQSGMVARWMKLKGPRWHLKAVLNGAGAVTTAVVLLVVGSAKFLQGAWMVIALIPVLVFIFLTIEHHYRDVADQLVITEDDHDLWQEIGESQHIVLVPVPDVNRAALRDLAYAKSLAKAETRIQAVHVTDDVEAANALQAKWKSYGVDVPLHVLESPFRALVGPLLSYIDALERQNPTSTITVILPEFLPARPWEFLLHTQTALRLKGALLFRPRTVVASVPYHLHR